MKLTAGRIVRLGNLVAATITLSPSEWSVITFIQPKTHAQTVLTPHAHTCSWLNAHSRIYCINPHAPQLSSWRPRIVISDSCSLSVKYNRNKFDNCNHLSIISDSLALWQDREKGKLWISNGTNFTIWLWTKSQVHEWIILINQQQAYESFWYEGWQRDFLHYKELIKHLSVISANRVYMAYAECIDGQQ